MDGTPNKTTVRIDELTRAEFETLARQDPVILLPLGSLEQHGPACPMGDYRITTKLAEDIAAASSALVAPTLPFGHANYFRCAPGGISLSADTFSQVLDDMCRAFTEHGIRKILILNGHGGNRVLINGVTHAIREESGIVIPAVNLWGDIPGPVWEKAHPGIGKRAFGHGGDPIASLYAYLFPGSLREGQRTNFTGNKTFRDLPVTSMSTVSIDGLPVQVPLNVDDVNPLGMTGGGTLHASAEAGKVFFDYLSTTLTKFIDEFWAPKGPDSKNAADRGKPSKEDHS